jgi:hypothetical protein
MNLRYQTATITFIQFFTMVVLGLANALVSIISTCHNNSSDCTSNMISSSVLFLLTPVWFGLILAAGYFAQKNRSNRLAGVLIGLELITIVVAGHFNFPRESNWLAKGTSLLDVLLGIIAIYLALQLLLARGDRIVKRTRKRGSSS